MYGFIVPADNPELGETWELYDPLQAKASQAVVVETTEGSPNMAPTIRVMNRLGRRITLARALFRLNWRFLHEAPNQACWYAERPEKCRDKAYFRILSDSGWTWICTRHIPAGHTVQFPFDRLDERALGTSEIGCPNCHTPTRAPGSGTEYDEASQLHVNSCGRCGASWVRLDLEAEEGSSIRLVEQVAQAAEALHGRVRNTQAFIGFEAWAAVRQVIQPQVHIQGVPLRQNPAIGPRTVLVTGDSVFTQTRTPEPRNQAAPLLPAVGSFWIQIRGGRIVEVLRIESSDDVVVFQVPDQDKPSTMRVREFLRQFRVNTPREDEVQILPHEPVHQDRPLPGDTWWSWDTKQPVMILGLKANEVGAEMVRFRGSAIPEMTVPVEDFIQEFQLEPPVPDCLPGEEWIDDQSKIVRIRSVDMEKRRIVAIGKSGVVELIPLGTFASSFKKLERVSVHARILEEDED